LGATIYSVKSDNSNTSTVSATVLDTANAVIAGVPVTFTTDAGQLSSASATTDVNGVASVTFSSGTGNRNNQLATITANVGTLPQQTLQIAVGGSTLSLATTTTSLTTAAPPTNPITDTLKATALDAGGNPIAGALIDFTVTSPSIPLPATGTITDVNASAPQPLQTLSAQTDGFGVATVTIEGTGTGSTGSLVIEAKGLGDQTKTQNYTVSAAANAFRITSPVVSATPPALETAGAPVVLWTPATPKANAIKIAVNKAATGTPVQTRIAFATTLGTWTAVTGNAPAPAATGLGTAVVVCTLSGTSATATLASTTSGVANIRVYDPDHPDVYSDVRTVVIASPFVANPSMTLQSDVSQLPASVGGASNSTILRATVRTPAPSQPIAGVPVLFSITNPTGGGETVSPTVGFTDASGVVQATFKAGSLASGANGVTVQAQIIDPTTNLLGTAQQTSIIIGGVPASIVLGRSTVGTASSDDTYYTMPMMALVVDGSGSPMANTAVSLKIWPSYYRTGYWAQVPDSTITTTSGGTSTSVSTLKWQVFRSNPIPNEDTNKNLIHDRSPVDEDTNGDGVLTPPNAAGGTIPASVTTDKNGLASFVLIYPKAMAAWIDDDIKASVRVSGTEYFYTYPFSLPVLQSDVDAGLVLNSPFISGGSGTMTITGGSGRTDTPLSFTVNLTDALGNSASNVPVSISTTMGVVAPFPLPATDASGNVTFTIQSYLPGSGVVSVVASGYQTGIKTFTVAAGIPAKSSISLTSTNTLLGSSVGVSAVVSDQYGNPVEDGTVVNFQSTGLGGLWSKQYGQTSGGIATATYTPTSAGNETLSASVVQNLPLGIVTIPPGTASLKVAAPVVGAISLQLNSNAPLVANGAASVVLDIAVTDATGAPIVGIVPVVSTNLGLLSAPLATDSFGLTSVTLTTQNTIGTATVTVTSGVVQTSADVQFVGGVAANGTLSFSPNNVAVGDPTLPVVSARFVDVNGNPIPDGTQIKFSVTAGSATLGAVYTTTTGGVASTTVTPNATGTVTIQADVTGTAATASNNLTVMSPQVTSVTLLASQLSQYADGTPVTLTATLKDSLGNSASGVTVSFTSTFGALTALTAVTNAAGQASVDLSSAVTGNAVVTASVTGTSPQTVSVDFVAVTTPAVPTSLGLGTSQVSVKSDGSDFATLTATVLDANNVVIPNATVSFAAAAGQLGSGNAVTDASGKATVSFSAGSVDPQNQVVLITATIGVLSRQIPVQISGSTVSATASAPSVTDNGSDSSSITVTVLDAGGKPVYNTAVSLKASINNKVLAGVTPLTTAAIALGTTDINGQVQTAITGISAGTVTLTASALNASWNLDLTVNAAANVLSVTAPATSPFPQTIGSPVTVTVSVPNPGLGVGQTHFVTFATTLGELDGVAGQRVVSKDVSALAAPASVSAVLTSSGAGLANVLIYDDANSANRANTQIAFSADISTAATVRLQATASTLPISTAASVYTTTLRAQVQTSSGQPVGNVPVAFSLPNPIGGGESVSPSIAYTDSSGIATATFSAGALSSGANGVTVQADVFRQAPLTTLTGATSIIIGGVAGSVIVGEAALDQVVDAGGGSSALYKVPMAVMVADAGGNPVANSIVTLSLWPSQYSTGSYVVYGQLLDGTPLTSAQITGSYPNEDANENLVLDVSEDANGDGLLTPPNTASGSVPRTVTTDANGVANFEMIYPKANANWITARLRASVLVSGTETSSEHLFRLPANHDDALYGKLGDSPFAAPGAAFLTVSPTSIQAVADGTAQTITANVVQISGGPVADGTSVDFATTFGTLSAASATTTAGAASITVSSTVVGQGAVTATTGSATPQTTTISFIPGNANTAQLDVAPNATALGTAVTLTARVFDAQGNPVADSTGVDFSSSAGGTFTAIHVGTVGGIATTSFTPTAAGNHTITATVTGAGVSTTGALYVSALPVGSISLTPSQNVQIANGSAVTLTAVITDTSGNLMSGQPVSFSGNFGTLSAVSATTLADGTASVTIASTVAGSANVTASSSTVTGTAAVTFVPGAAANTAVSLGSSTVSLGSSTTVTVAVTDATGNAAADGTGVDLASSLGGTFSKTHLSTLGGAATATYTPTTAGAHTLTSTVTGSAPAVSGSATLQVGSLPVGAVTVVPAVTQLVADVVSTTTVSIKVLDTSGAPVVGVIPTISADNAVTVGAATATDANGVSTATLTAGATVGVSTITASNGGISGTGTVTLIGGAAATVSVAATPNNVALGQTTTVTARVVDAQGNAVPNGTQVTFAETTATGAVLSALNVVTVNGNASITVNPAVAGAVTIGATVGGLPQVTTNITVNTLSAASLTLGASQTSQTADGASLITFTTTVQDSAGNGVNGVTVTFTSSLGALSALTATTAGGGLATVTLSSTTIGTAAVTATASGLTQAKSVSFVPGVASAASTTLSAGNVTLGGSTTVSVRVTDATGNAVLDGTGVDLVSNLGGAFSIAHVATFNGIASTAFTPSANGTHTITATVTGSAITGTATLQVASLAVGSMTVTPSASQLVADGAATMTVAVRVHDTSGAPMVGVTPSVIANNGMSVGAVAATGADGSSTVTLTAGSAVGTATIAASASGVSGSVTVALVGGAAASTTVSSTPNNLALGQTTTVTARVLDAQGNPVPDGTQVAFAETTATGSTLSATYAITAGGNASITVTPAASGTVTIGATVGALAQVTTNITVNTLSAASMTLAADQTVQTADGASLITLTATVKDSAGNGVNGVTVSFTSTLGTLSGLTAVTAGGGVATVTLSSPATGTATVTATASGLTQSQALSFVAGSASGVSVTLSPSNVQVGSSTTVTAVVTDAKGNAVVDGTQVTFSGGTGTFGVTVASTVSGSVSTSFVPSASGAHTLTATSGAATANATLTANALAVGSVTVTPSAPTLVADGASTITVDVTVRDATGAPLSGVTPTVSVDSDVTVGAVAATGVTGISTVTLTAGSTVGTATISATASGVSASGTVQMIGGAAASVTVSATPNNVSLGNTTTVTARVLDAQGNPVPNGTQVAFAETTATSATLSSLYVTTTSGNASITVTPAAAGTVTIGATVGALAQVTTNITVNTLSAASMTLAADQTVQTADGASLITLTATVKDSAGNGVNGVTVSFTSTLGTLSGLTAVTAGGGVATVTLSSPATGTATVTATASGLTQSQALSFVAGSASGVSVTLSPSNVQVGSSTTVTAVVTDAKGNAVVDGTQVTFSGGTGTFGVTVASTVSGSVSTSFVPSASGAHTLTATSGAATANATLTANALAVGSVTVTPSAPTLVADGASTITVDVTVRDATGAPLSGVTPTVSVDSDVTVGAVAATGVTGISTVTLTAGSTVGTATISATASGVSASGTVQMIGGAAASVTVSATPNNVSLGNTTTVTARVLDAQGNPVPNGTQVAFAETTATSATLSSLYVTTTSGNASITVTPAAAGTVTIGATVGALAQVTTNITVNTLSAASMTLAVDQTTQTADLVAVPGAVITVSATVKDAVGNGVNGVTVTFTSTVGSLSATTAVTNASGVATVTLSSTTVGAGAVTATASGLTQSQAISFVPGTASNVAVSLSPNNVQSGSSTTVTVRVTDATGNAVLDGTGVDLASTSAGTFGASHLSTSSGSATTIFTPSAVATHTVSATVTGTAITGSGTLTVNSASSSTLTLTTAVSLSQLTANNIDTSTLTATVKDSSGNAVIDGTVVSFVTDRGTLTSGATTANVVTATTTGGVATVTVDAGKVAEMRTITVTASGLTSTQQVTFNPGVMNIGATTSRILSNPSSVAAGATATFTIVAVDANNNPLANGTVFNVSATAGTLAAVTATTSSGIATFSWTAPSSGVTSVTFTATASGGSLTQTVAITGTATGSFNPVSMSVAVSGASISVLGEGTDTTTLTVTVVDEAGNAITDPTAGNNVEVKILSGPNGGELLSDGVTTSGNGGAALPLTTVNGQASVNLKAGTIPGTVRVQFQAVKDQTGALLGTPVTAISAPIAINSGAPNSLVVLLNNGNSAITNNNNGSYSRDVSALVLDQYGNPVPDGTAVYFGLIDYWTMGAQTDTTRTYPAAVTQGSTTAGAATFTDGSALLDYTTGNNGQGGVAVGDKIYVSSSPAGTDMGIHYISAVNSTTNLTVFNNFAETSALDQYVIGRAQYAKVGGSATTTSGIAKVVLTYPVAYMYYPVMLHAETAANGVWNVYNNASSYAALAPLTLTASPATLKSAPGTAISAVVTVKDSGGNIVPRVQANVSQAPSAASATLTGLTLSAAGITNASGQVTVTATIPGTAAPADTIAVTVDCGGYTATINITVN